MKAETKYKGSVKLSAIGDALGWLTEFERSKQSIQKKYGVEKIEKFFRWEKTVGGRFFGYKDNIKAGSYSDDTQLMLCVARSIVSGGRIDNEYFSKTELINWLSYARGGGRTIKTAAEKIARKSASWNKNFFSYKVKENRIDYRESGANGVAMRVLPIALANLGNFDRIKEEIFCNSIVTHGHPRAIIGAMLYGYAINQIIVHTPDNFYWEKFITNLGTDFQNKFAFSFQDVNEIKEWLQEWNKNSKESFEQSYTETLLEVQNQLRLIYKSIKYNNDLNDTLKKLGCFEYKTKGSGTATVVAGIYIASKYSEKPIDGIIEAVNFLGSDTDSIAAFTGGLLGALHGQNIIPDKLKAVQDFNYLDKISERLLAISEDRYQLNEQKTITLNQKQLNNLESNDISVGDQIYFNPLGNGIIKAVDRQPTLTKGKYNLIIEVDFEIGQSCVFSQLFDEEGISNNVAKEKDTYEPLLKLASQNLKPETFMAFETFMTKQKKISKSLVNILGTVLKNEK